MNFLMKEENNRWMTNNNIIIVIHLSIVGRANRQNAASSFVLNLFHLLSLASLSKQYVGTRMKKTKNKNSFYIVV